MEAPSSTAAGMGFGWRHGIRWFTLHPVDGKQHSIRLTAEDVAVIKAIQERTGIIGTSPAIRFALRQYALVNKVEFRQSGKKKAK